MSTEDYIRNERKMIQEECQKLNMTPSEWILRFAKVYHEKYASFVLQDHKK